MAKNKIPKEAIAEEAWSSWTPTTSGITIGNGTLVAKYTKLGKTVNFNLKFVFGSTSAITGTPVFSPPVAAADTHNALQAIVEDSGTALLCAIATLVAGNIYVYAAGAATSYVSQTNMSATVPMTWAAGDVLYINGTYQAS